MEEIIQKRFGKLTILELLKEKDKQGRKVRVICDCGKVFITSLWRIKNRGVSRCMKCRPQAGANSVDMTGERIGRLVVIKKIGRNKAGDSLWLCKCDCGNFKEVPRPSLREKMTQSCGCLYKESRFRKKNVTKYKLPPQEATKNYAIKQYIQGARGRNLEWNLSKEDALDLLFGNCYYCGVPPCRMVDSVNRSRKGTSILVNGIDRLDNNIGYNKENTVSCCTVCNHAKKDMTTNQFYDWIKRLCNHNN